MSSAVLKSNTVRPKAAIMAIFFVFCLSACNSPELSPDKKDETVSLVDGEVSYKGKQIGVLPEFVRKNAQNELEAAGFYPKLPNGVLVPEITVLTDRRILLSGGVDKNNTYSRKTWFFDSESKKLSKGPDLAKESIKHATLVLPDAKVLISGGSTARPNEIELIQVLDPVKNEIETIANLVFARYEHSMVLLSPDSVAITGGATRNGDQDEVEVLDLKKKKSRMVGHLAQPRKQHESMKIDSNSVLVLGGQGFEYKEEELKPEVFIIPENK